MGSGLDKVRIDAPSFSWVAFGYVRTWPFFFSLYFLLFGSWPRRRRRDSFSWSSPQPFLLSISAFFFVSLGSVLETCPFFFFGLVPGSLRSMYKSNKKNGASRNAHFASLLRCGGWEPETRPPEVMVTPESEWTEMRSE